MTTLYILMIDKAWSRNSKKYSVKRKTISLKKNTISCIIQTYDYTLYFDD